RIEGESGWHSAADIDQPHVDVALHCTLHGDAPAIECQLGVSECVLVCRPECPNYFAGAIDPDKLPPLTTCGPMRDHAGCRHRERATCDSRFGSDSLRNGRWFTGNDRTADRVETQRNEH